MKNSIINEIRRLMTILNPTFWRIIPPNVQKSEVKWVTDSLHPSKLTKNRFFQKCTVKVIVKVAKEWKKEGNSGHLRLRAGYLYLLNVEKKREIFFSVTNDKRKFRKHYLIWIFYCMRNCCWTGRLQNLKLVVVQLSL